MGFFEQPHTAYNELFSFHFSNGYASFLQRSKAMNRNGIQFPYRVEKNEDDADVKFCAIVLHIGDDVPLNAHQHRRATKGYCHAKRQHVVDACLVVVDVGDSR